MSSTSLHDFARYVTATSSIALRLGAWFFLRWIPGHLFPPGIFSLFALYLPFFVYSLTHTTPYRIIADEIDIITSDLSKESEVGAKDGDPNNADGDEDDEPVQEVDVEETIVLEEKGPETLKTLLLGLPSPTRLYLSAATFLINAALVYMVWDLTFKATIFYPAHGLSMARVGYVSNTTAKILIREPDVTKLPVFVSYRYADAPLRSGVGFATQPDTSWKAGGQLNWLDASSDFTGTFTLDSLKADTQYQYVVSNNHSGSFITAPRPGSISSRPSNAGTFTFLHSSCLKNNFPYNVLAHPLANVGLRHLSQALPALRAQFMLFLGDFIYSDVPQRHGASTEDFRREYRQVYASPDWPDAAKDLPWLHVYDDHEVANDWSSNTTGLFPAAFDPYEHYHISVNPPPLRKGDSYFQFDSGPATFFMLDTRRYRSPNDDTNGTDPITGDATKTMLGATQLEDLLSWLKRRENPGVKWKIVISSIPFTQNWWYGARDTWHGYLGERQIILEAMWDVGLRGGIGVVVLSGDRHEFAATAFPPPPDGKEEIVGLGPIGLAANPITNLLAPDSKATIQTRRKRWPLSATVHEFSASPLSMFYLPVRTYAESSTARDYVSDVCIKYLPDGNSKFGAVSITNPATSDQSVLHYRLFVDGVETWSYTLTTPPEIAGGGRAKDAVWG